jgi:uncharacterized LabA/DUF88 family protein
MTNTSPKDHVAVLIDADNVQLNLIKKVLKFAERYGSLVICCAYGDWKQAPLVSSTAKMDELKIERVQVNRVEKNATDHRLLVGVGEILGRYSGKNDVGVFVIVSGDGHFASACQLLRERQKRVIGIGNKEQSNKKLRAACNQFIYLEDIDQATEKRKKNQPSAPSEADMEALRLGYIFDAFMQTRQPDGRANLSQFTAALRKLDPAHETHFGTTKISTLLKAYTGKFKVDGHYVSLVE